MKIISEEDIDRFLNGEVPPGSPEWMEIVDELAANHNGFTAQSLKRRREEAIHQAEDWANLILQKALAFSSKDEQVGDISQDKGAEDELSVASSDGERLRSVRMEQGLTIEDLARSIEREFPGSRLNAKLIEAIEADLEPLDVLATPILASALGIKSSVLMPVSEAPQSTILLSEEPPIGKELSRTDEADRGGVADIERELSDFLPLDVAREMIAAWKQGTLQTWIASFMRVADDYQDSLILALAAMSLAKDHVSAAPHLAKLVENAGDEPQRLQDAYFLCGRGQWYLKQYDKAVADLLRAIDLGSQTRNQVRLSQAEYYLARVAIVLPKCIAESPDKIMERAEDRARQIGRPDIELLAKRGRMIWYRNNKQRDRAIPLGRELLDPRSRWMSLGMSHILDNVYVDLGLSLRGLHTEEARLEAERYYQHGIDRGRDDSHAGMCLYLMADLYVDRMIAEQQKAAEERSNPDAAATALFKAEEHRKKALSLSEHAHRILQNRGDKAALEKANRRLVFLEMGDVPHPFDEEQIIADYAVRVQRFTELFLGAPKRSVVGAYSPQINELGKSDLQELLKEYFTGLLVKPGQSAPSTISIESFLRPNTLLCLPWIVGSSLVVRVFGSFEGPQKESPQKIVNIGWFVLRHYTNEIRLGLSRICELRNHDFLGLRRRYFHDLQKRVETIDPMSRHEHPGLSGVRDVIVLSPQSNQEWLCPVEWFRTGPDRNEPGLALFDYAVGSLVFTSTIAGPFKALQEKVGAQEWRIVATSQLADEKTIFDHACRSLGQKVERWDLAAPFPEGRSKGIIIIAHADVAGSVERALVEATLGPATCVALLFCSSGQYSMTSGPFVDGIARTIHSKLPVGGLVIGARVPVSLMEATRFATELHKEGASSRPLAEVVTGYINASRFYGDTTPFETPWVVLT